MATIEESVAQAMNAAARAMSSASDAATSAQQSKTWATAQLNQVAFGGVVRGLVVTVTGTGYQGTIQCSRCIVEGYDGGVSMLKNVNLTFNAASVGANGLDTGAISAGNWYYLYIISDGTNISSLVSLSSTAPTLPTGYSRFLRVGSAYVAASTTAFIPSKKTGRTVSYADSAGLVVILNNISLNGNLTVPLATAIPPTSSLITLSCLCSSGNASVYPLASNTVPLGTFASGFGYFQIRVPLSTSQQLVLKNAVASSGIYLYCSSYEED